MNTRVLSPSDAPEIYDAFMSSQVDGSTALERNSGFYKYPLKEGDIRDRLKASGDHSIVLTDRRQVLAYALTYPFGNLGEIDSAGDFVLSRLQGKQRALYFD